MKPIFYHALQPSGFFLLEASESDEVRADRYEAVYRQQEIHLKKEGIARAPVGRKGRPR